MSRIDRVFSISEGSTSGRNSSLQSMILDEESIRLSSKKTQSLEEFDKTWYKKISFRSKREILYSKIKTIQKLENSNSIFIQTEGWSGNLEFSFDNGTDYPVFIDFFEQEKGFKKTEERLTPFKSVKGSLIGLAVILGITGLAYWMASHPDGDSEHSGRAKGRIIKALVNLLGEKGVLIVGGLAVCYFGYQIWRKYTNPPQQTKWVRGEG